MWGSNSPWPKQTTRLLACWVEEAHGNQSKGYKSLKWKEEEESNQCRFRRCAKRQRSCKLLKSGDADHCRQADGGEWHVTVGTALAAMKSSSIYVCGCESKAKEGTDARTDGRVWGQQQQL